MSSAFAFTRGDDGIGVITFDTPDQKVNTLGTAVLNELEAHIFEFERRGDLRGLLFRSGKPGQFIAGADLHELSAASTDKDRAAAIISLGHRVFDRLSRLPFPTVALIDGNCMGGGTELALALDERICTDSRSTKIALPETQIGLVPGWGGTQRLPRLVGLDAAISMICGAESVGPARAREIGLVWDAVPPDRLLAEGRRLIEILEAEGDLMIERERRSGGLGIPPGRMLFAFGVAEGAIREKTKGHYPAPLAALQAMKAGINLSLTEALRVEQSTIHSLVGTPTAAHLIDVFFMQNKLSRDSSSITPRPIGKVGVLGAGFMGAGIAAAHARSAIPTAMVDIDRERVDAGLARAREVVESRIRIGRAKVDDLAAMLARLDTSTSIQSFADADVVIEAVIEDEAAKVDAFRSIERVVGPETILASNTSTISITRMAESIADPSRFVGMHFFSPVDRMELVEIVRGEKTSDATVAAVQALARKIRKTPIVVRDCPGFLVNRVLFPYMNEAQTLVSEGVSIDAIDAAATKFGMPMGPIALLDMVGLDIALHAGRVLAAAYPDRAAVHPMLEALVAAGHLGKKSGKGFRRHDPRKSRPMHDPDASALIAHHVRGASSPSPETLIERLFFPMLLEATRVLEEKIVDDADVLDMGLILGTGFPPFRGGLLHWADGLGAATIVERLGDYARLGTRYLPTESLLRAARDGGRFHPAKADVAAA
ncbi:MAG: 3-hydroxyacyl-CoA dehydrogenase NAD-binding domain-containing protein [Isosphaeraceae bacterium]|nr:3-hydroxyacyl-CoA dehydrogenase NAD-binding domain-containing protein [Isosphaeraceae bacterium]